MHAGVDGLGVTGLDQDLGLLAEPSAELGLENIECLYVGRVLREEVGEGELGLQLREAVVARTSQQEGDENRGDGHLLGQPRGLLHQPRQRSLAVGLKRVNWKGGIGLRSPIGEHPHRRHEGEHQDK